MLRELIARGGIIMYPLLLCSIAALAVVVERIVYFILLRRSMNGTEDRMKVIHRLLIAGDFNKATNLLREGDGPMVRVILSGLTASGQEGRLRETYLAASTERRRFFSGLSILDTIVTAAPLLGLLGTVTGILNTFNLLGTQPAMGNMQAVGKGIAEALITTATGLIIAIPTLVALNYFVHRAENLNEALDREVENFNTIMSERGEHDVRILEAQGQG